MSQRKHFFQCTAGWLMETFSYLKSGRLCNAETNTRDTVQLVTVLFAVYGRKSLRRQTLPAAWERADAHSHINHQEGIEDI